MAAGKQKYNTVKLRYKYVRYLKLLPTRLRVSLFVEWGVPEDLENFLAALWKLELDGQSANLFISEIILQRHETAWGLHHYIHHFWMVTAPLHPLNFV